MYPAPIGIRVFLDDYLASPSACLASWGTYAVTVRVCADLDAAVTATKIDTPVPTLLRAAAERHAGTKLDFTSYAHLLSPPRSRRSRSTQH
jgi:hypothetical protein